MYSLTKNELRVIDFLIRNFREKNSINEIGRRLEISPRGIYKILKKLEKINAIVPENIGNAIYYKINLEDNIGIKLSEFVLTYNELNSYSNVVDNDLKPLREVTECCILFGSVIEKGINAKDIDILLVFEKENFNKINNILNNIKNIKPKRIHDIIQNKKDLENNIRKNDEVILDIIKKGKILWGSEIIVYAIKDGAS